MNNTLSWSHWSGICTATWRLTRVVWGESWGWATSTWGAPPSTALPLPHSMNWTRERECAGQLDLCQQRVTLWSSPHTTSATNMCVGRLLGSPTTIHEHAFHLSQYYTVWSCAKWYHTGTQWAKLCTAVVAGVHLHHSPHTLFGRR